MPRPLSYWPPGELRVRLADARDRGLDFDAAWAEAMGLVHFPRGGGSTDIHGRYAWREALEATRPAWEAAYRLEPAGPGAQALRQLAGALDSRSELPPIAA